MTDDVPRDMMLELAFVDDDSYSRQAILDGQWRFTNNTDTDDSLTTRQGATFDVDEVH
jgi:hypothetical protein